MVFFLDNRKVFNSKMLEPQLSDIQVDLFLFEMERKVPEYSSIPMGTRLQHTMQDLEALEVNS